MPSLVTLFACALSAVCTLDCTDAWALCFERTCERKDPSVTGCDKDAVRRGISDLKSSKDGTVLGSITSWYSPICNAKWATFVALTETTGTSADIVLVDDTDGAVTLYGYKRLYFFGVTTALITSTMTEGNRVVFACGNLGYSDYRGHGCTSSY